METKALLEVIRVQRHDFLNHLQVISGLFQLNKGEQVRDYIRQVTGEFERMGRIVHLKIPEAAAALLVACNQAGERQIEMNVQIQCDLSRCFVPGEVVERVLKAVFQPVLAVLAAPEVNNRALAVQLSEEGEHYTLRLSWTRTSGLNLNGLTESLTVVNGLLAACGGQAGLMLSPEQAEIFIILPGRSERTSDGT